MFLIVGHHPATHRPLNKGTRRKLKGESSPSLKTTEEKRKRNPPKCTQTGTNWLACFAREPSHPRRSWTSITRCPTCIAKTLKSTVASVGAEEVGVGRVQWANQIPPYNSSKTSRCTGTERRSADSNMGKMMKCKRELPKTKWVHFRFLFCFFLLDASGNFLPRFSLFHSN